ncbi:MAG: orotate phosphoribosyltransferase [Bdellovibrionales bacterium GWB1_55_8]|nr:MAG: orotate phosphoribosyltransferase [Bdellovibrionales bacterium GWB1_55_8]
MDFEKRRAELIALIRKLSYREGDFTLASGQKSSFYIDLKATTLHPLGAKLIGELAVELLKREGTVIDAVGGLTLGADPLATAISLGAFDRGISWPALIVRKEPKGHGTSRFVEGMENVGAGAHVLVLEDVTTTGGSAVKAAERLREAGLLATTALTVVDREQGGAKALLESGVKLLRLATIAEIRTA